MQKCFFRIWFIIAFAIICTGFNSCAARLPVVISDEAFISGERRTAAIATINEELGRIIFNHADFIREQNQLAIGGIDDALDRLDEYDEFVQRLISELLELKARISEMDS